MDLRDVFKKTLGFVMDVLFFFAVFLFIDKFVTHDTEVWYSVLLQAVVAVLFIRLIEYLIRRWRARRNKS